jgi:hypothetical protein
MRGGTLGRAIGRVDVSYPRRIGPTPGSIIAGIRPELARFGAAAARIEHGRGGLVRKQLGRGLQVVEQPLVHRAQVERGPPHPVSQGGAVEPETLTGVDLRLPVEREVIGVFGDEDLRDRAVGGQPALDQPRRRGGLHDPILTGAAGVLRAADDQHPDLGRHDVEALGHVLADAVQGAGAARARRALDIHKGLNPRQVGRQ